MLFKRTLQPAMTLRSANRRTWWCVSTLGRHQAVITCFHKPPDCQAVLLCYKEQQPQRALLAARLIKWTLPAFPVEQTNSFGGCLFQQSDTLPSALLRCQTDNSLRGRCWKANSHPALRFVNEGLFLPALVSLLRPVRAPHGSLLVRRSSSQTSQQRQRSHRICSARERCLSASSARD